MSDTIVISTLAACNADEHGSCYGWLETDPENGLGVRCGHSCHLNGGGWKFDRLRAAHVELDLIFKQFTLGEDLFRALRSVERIVAE